MPASEAIAKICQHFGLTPSQAASAGIFSHPTLAAIRGQDIDAETLTQLVFCYRTENPSGSLGSFLTDHHYFFDITDL